jgi:predicted metal-binding protein
VNNLAVSFAQHPLDRSVETIAPPANALPLDHAVPKTRAELLEAAENWARNAYRHALEVKDVDRTSECDQACAVALCNLGDILSMMGDVEEARRRFGEAVAASETIGFSQGISQAQAGLRKLAESSTQRT